VNFGIRELFYSEKLLANQNEILAPL